MDRIFVYGTLRPKLYPKRRPIGVEDVVGATLAANLKMFNLGAFPALVEDAGVHLITGESYTLPDITVFDAYEGYLPNGRGLYDRSLFQIELEDGLKTQAWVYWMHKERHEFGDVIDSGDWADVLRRSPRAAANAIKGEEAYG